MALKKIIQVEGEAFVNTMFGQVKIGSQKIAFTAYCKITHINGNKENGQITVESKSDDYFVIQHYNLPFSVNDEAPNFIKQGYLHLKTLPEWADATDC